MQKTTTIERTTEANAYILFKRVFDVWISILAGVIIAPIMLICCIMIYIEDPQGSPVFKQERCGENGAIFKMYKLRTMRCNAENELSGLLHMNEADGPVFKIKDDPRITKVGKFLRKTNLDEFPQLINVIKGDMSLVGPRPPLPREVEQYNAKAMERLSVTPGITCYWQIIDNKNDLPFEDWLRLDLKYINEKSLKTDFFILLKTAGTVFRMTGV